MKLRFVHKEQIAADTWNIMFAKPEGFVYEPGQFLEVNLKHPKHDDRGEQRWFTMSSSPTETDIMITTRHVDKPSSFKNALFDLKPGDELEAEGPMGKFILPSNPKTQLVWIAGGIGTTPFRSQIKFLLDNQELNRTITFIYSNRTKADICFEELWLKANNEMPFFNKVETLVDEIPDDWDGERGLVDEAMITRAVGELSGKHFYISGPEPMVQAFVPKLEGMGIAKDNIHTDEFPGYDDSFFKV